MKKLRTSIKLIAAIAVSLGLVMIAPLSASAWATTYPVSGQLNSGGHLMQYGTYRWHGTGTAGLNVTSNIVGGYSAFGLRDVNNIQVTNSIIWSNSGSGATSNTGLKWFATTSGSSSIPGQYLAINGRMTTVGGGYYNINWSGVLYL